MAITLKDLKVLEQDINSIIETEHLRAKIHKDYLGYALLLKNNYGSVVKDLTLGRFTKRELYFNMNSFLRGLRYAGTLHEEVTL